MKSIILSMAIVLFVCIPQDGKGREDVVSRNVLYSFGSLSAFTPNKFMKISGTVDARVEDLKVTPEKEIMGRFIEPMATVNIKNLTEMQLHISVYLALLDGNENIVACGNFSTMSRFGGFKPRETDTETIRLGFAGDLERVRYYQYRVATFLEEPRER